MNRFTRIICVVMGIYGMYLALSHQITLFQVGVMASVALVSLSTIGHNHE